MRYRVPLASGEAVQVDAVAEETVEPLLGDDAGDVAIPETQLVVRRSELRSADARGRCAPVVEGAELWELLAVHNRNAVRRVANAQIARVEVLRTRRGQDKKRRKGDEAYEQSSHATFYTPFGRTKVPH